MQSLRRSSLVIRKIATKENVVALFAQAAGNHDCTIAKNKRFEADLSDLALQAFN
jgi:hypothetical protein